MSNVHVVPGASRQKLPFVHSNFKPRSKLAKTFGGCTKFSKAKQDSEDGVPNGKLPRIVFNTHDRRTTISFGAIRRGTRKEYPGFVGQTKTLKRKDSRLNRSSNAVSNSGVHDGTNTETATGGCNNSSSYVSSNFSAEKRIQDKNFGHLEDGNGLLSDMDSLFIIDDEDTDVTSKTDDLSQNMRLYQTAEPEKVYDEDKIFANNPFAKNVSVKLQEARGKSGMKRPKRGRKDRDRPMRTLGDVITHKRLQELLSPRVVMPSLKFAGT